MEATIDLTLQTGEKMILQKEYVRVIERLPLGSLVTLVEGAQYRVNEDSDTILELLKTRVTK